MVGVQLTPDPGPGRGTGALGKGRPGPTMLAGRGGWQEGGVGERFHHRRPQQGRARSPSGGTFVRDARNGEAVEPQVKISPVAPLSWPGEVVDGALWLLTSVPRKTTLRNLGGEPDKVIETLLDAFDKLHTTDEEKEGAIQFINAHDRVPDKILAEAM